VQLTSDAILTNKVIKLGIYSWDEAVSFVHNLPYGRNTNRSDLSLVLSEKKGTCSSKHGFLKALATENNLLDIQLFIAIYKMNLHNTPGIGCTLTEHNLPYIPEAHCFLRVKGVPIDVTQTHSNFNKIQNSILVETEIESYQVSEYKIDLHQNFVSKWITVNNIPFTFEEIWNFREQCIQNLATRA